MTARLLTPSKITAWLCCEHALTLQHQLESGAIAPVPQPFGSFARLLANKGLEHEAACLEAYRAQGLSILEIPDRAPTERFADWVERIGDPFAGDHDVIYQMPFAHDGVRGVADFVLRVIDEKTGQVSYEPVDAKLARSEAKPGHVLQLCFYAEAIEALTGIKPKQMHLWLGSGEFETIRTDDVMPYWRHLRSGFHELMSEEGAKADTTPVPCDHCEVCDFEATCAACWRSEDAVHLVANVRTMDVPLLEASGIGTLAGLADARPGTEVEGIDPDRLAQMSIQAELQRVARDSPDEAPPFRFIDVADGPPGSLGYEQLPKPDDGDVFLDFEGHPFWRPSDDLIFLFGWICRDPDGDGAGDRGGDGWTYHARWAHDLAEERTQVGALIEYLAERRVRYPDMHVYHYNHTERSALERLAGQYGVGEVLLDDLVGTGAFVDLLVVIRGGMQVGVESYGLKHLEALAGYQRGDDIEQGAGAVVAYEEFMAGGDPATLDRIAAYNADDVRATRAVRDWLVEQRNDAHDWRDAELVPNELPEELEARVEALKEFGPDTDEHLLADVLGYWQREWSAHKAQQMSRLAGSTSSLLDDPLVIGSLRWEAEIPRVHKRHGGAIDPAMRFSFPHQDVESWAKPGKQVFFEALDGQTGYSSVVAAEPGVLDLAWNESSRELGVLPEAIVFNDWVAPKPKPEALDDFAARLLDPEAFGAPNPVSLALLRRELPRFVDSEGPPGATFAGDLDEMRRWAPSLDHSYVAVQGPPGTGKTYSGAHLILELIRSGQRVGITAFSHSAIDNLLSAVVKVFGDNGESELLRAVRRGAEPRSGGLPGVTYAGGNLACANGTYNLVAGTTWLFAGKDLRGAPVDTLIVDEAGQLSLADTLAASGAATNLILLGDPLQLAQVSKASHPHGSGASVLEHVLGDEATMPAERGVFLDVTRRMHPDVCRFISERVYDGRLVSHESCAQQTTEFGTGLRWVPVRHEGRSTESVEEAEAVAREVDRLLGTDWTNQRGETRPLEASDIMVVAPYNDQVNLMRVTFEAQGMAGVPVGTVDRFQGQEAAVVFYTMTASSASDAPRGIDFLFSQNRLNVAISRARCLAYLVSTPQLVNVKAGSLSSMRLLANLCAFRDQATRLPVRE
ncbi:TM0106 family RecB-like putative nuclease [Candidatus Neomicrothrix sp.]|uniref:TM0106 family RecB-like putative nuclease n=1 Tax=Candidatus Neomicrothrix sp. TaxID=2719034 RepID=UPI00259A21C2|nr:TM0106 family RecB-like putative nuclease [Candidatus Microthrix sp.]HMS46070.1 TM0106 family RecB-like putative nuclease [Candidatus Microthrix sp.]